MFDNILADMPRIETNLRTSSLFRHTNDVIFKVSASKLIGIKSASFFYTEEDRAVLVDAMVYNTIFDYLLKLSPDKITGHELGIIKTIVIGNLRAAEIVTDDIEPDGLYKFIEAFTFSLLDIFRKEGILTFSQSELFNLALSDHKIKYFFDYHISNGDDGIHFIEVQCKEVEILGVTFE